ncbi:MAG: hypothetical protein DMF71_00485 [Acidobacteria bacterium]|nr:MAG: hypothetical protein DMF71_00485 [Acidobacteriota bacterium]
MEPDIKKKPKIDMSAAAVTARIKRAGSLGDAERLMTIIRSLMAEIRGEKETPELLILIAEREGRIIQ